MSDQKIMYVFKCDATADEEVDTDDGGQGRSVQFEFDYNLNLTLSSYVDLSELDIDPSDDELYKMHDKFNNLIGRNLKITIETEP